MFYFLVVVVSAACTKASTLPEWHMKPLGSHIKPGKVDETFADNILSPEEFARNYVIPRKPIVFRDTVKTWRAFKLWTDEYLTEKYGDMEMRLEGKKEKGGRIPAGDVCLGRDRLKTFLNEYKKGADKYVVSDLPKPMWDEVDIPPSMSCGEFFNSYVEIDLWINSDLGKKGKGGNSILHKDAFNTVNCVVNGTKEWKLIELKYNDYVYQSWEGPMDAGYGGFSLINPEMVDAKKYPDIGKIPEWQFTTINAGDCLYLPSQMWHQVKSYGESNKAVAFLFSQFNDKKELDLSECPKKVFPVPLSEVDVDLQYPGHGIMPMGNSEISAIRQDLPLLVNKTTGYITKRSTIEMVYSGHENGAKNKHLMTQKAKDMYAYFLELAGGEKEKMTLSFVEKLSRHQIRPLYKWLLPIEPAGSYDHEYSIFLPEDLIETVETLKEKNKGILTKKDFLKTYENMGGTLKFAQNFWTKLAGDEEEIEDTSKTIEDATSLYEYHRRNDPELMDEDEEATITTPQGHKSQPKKMKGGYDVNVEEYEEEYDGLENPEEFDDFNEEEPGDNEGESAFEDDDDDAGPKIKTEL